MIPLAAAVLYCFVVYGSYTCPVTKIACIEFKTAWESYGYSPGACLPIAPPQSISNRKVNHERH